MRANYTLGFGNMIRKIGAFCGICIGTGVTRVHILGALYPSWNANCRAGVVVSEFWVCPISGEGSTVGNLGVFSWSMPLRNVYSAEQ